jgi:uncharacterized protein (TIGR04376 family)
MSIFDDLEKFLESRLDEFLKANPQLELQILDDKLREQELSTLRLVKELQTQQKQSQDKILAIAQDIQRWHERIQKAKQAGRQDLADAAQAREAELLMQGNQRWGQMEMVKQRLAQTQVLAEQIRERRQQVSQKMRAQPHRPSPPPPSSPYQSRPLTGPDPLEETFKQWEMDSELEELKRRMGR